MTSVMKGADLQTVSLSSSAVGGFTRQLTNLAVYPASITNLSVLGQLYQVYNVKSLRMEI